MAALATDKHNQRHFFLAGATADYCDLVSCPKLRQELVAAVLAELRRLAMPRRSCWQLAQPFSYGHMF